MKTKITPGAEIDALSPQEAEDILASLLGGEGRGEEPLRAEATGKTTGTGTLDPFVVYVVPQGQMAIITRLYISADGATYIFPFSDNNAAHFFGVEVKRNDVTVGGVGLAGNAGNPTTFLPWEFNQGKSQGIILLNGDALSVGFGGNVGPGNNIGVVVRIQGWLTPLAKVRKGS